MSSSNTPPEKSSYLETPLGSQRQQDDISAHGSGYFPPANTQGEYLPGYEDPTMTPRDLDNTRQAYPSQRPPQNQRPGQGQWSPYPPQSQAPYPPPSQGPYPPQSQGPYPPQSQRPYPPPSQAPYPPPSQAMSSPSPYSPPPQQQQQQFQQQQQQQTGTPPVQDIRLKLVNPRQLSSGFSELAPQALRQLAPSATEATWSQFISEINEQLHHAPGTLAKGVTNFWLVNLATLGMSSHAREMYRSRVESKAADILERYNRTVFGGWGIRVSFDVVPLGSQGSGSSSASDRDRRRRREQRDEPEDALELVITRA
ncbi:hypothetical protein LPJ53_003399 [Coemansia erecta]|uniref:Uncharacterized protein n=1 Tax=Coemansia erecta TaxID=147472 RepID=A0A9W7Y0T1_9FUNG|nr:hypothetical protein LPJ53_003399 [Coemansia erecta]